MQRHLMLRAFATCAVTALVAPVYALASARPAAAFTPPAESGLALVSNQNPGCANDEEVVVAKPKANGAFVKSYRRPATINGKLNDAKPIDNNRKVVALWGEQLNGPDGGVGIYDIASDTWTSSFPLPSAWNSVTYTGSHGDGLAHSVAAIEQPGQPITDVVVAQTGGIPGGNSWGNVVLFHLTSSTTATQKQWLPLAGVHGVEWDTHDNALYAVGDSYIEKYSYNPTSATPLARVGSWHLKAYNGLLGGHDLRRRRTSHTYYVTTNSAVWTFDPAIADANAAIQQVSGLSSGVKSIDQRFDGLVEWAQGDGQFHFTDGTAPIPASGFCMREYKVRWLYNPGEPVYNNDDPVAPAPAPQPSGTAERFVWEEHWLNGVDDLAGSNEIWAGKAAGDDTIAKAQAKVANAISAGKIPYVKFYQWGDSGSPTMGRVDKDAIFDDYKLWGDYAAAMAGAVGKTHHATFVVEPEWDSNAEAPCNEAYGRALADVVGKMRTAAPLAKIINGVGFWDNGTGKDPSNTKSKYHCFQESRWYLNGNSLASLFDGHGFVRHIMSNGTAPDGTPCGLRDPNNSEYKKGNKVYNGVSLADAKKKMTDVPLLLDRVKSIFGNPNTYITDIMLTSCGWGDTEQANIIKILTDQLQNNASNLYATHGLRGVAFRDAGPPDKSERYCGIWNEGLVTYKGNSTFMDYLLSARNGTQAYLASIAGPATDPPAFTVTVTNPPTVEPGGSAAVRLTVQNTKGSLSGGNVDLEIFAPDGTRATQKTWPNESFYNTQTKHYDYSWLAPATTGTYTIRAGVFDSAWTSPPIAWNNAAGTIAVGTAQPAFSATATATPATIAPDGTTSINVDVTDTGGALASGDVTVTLYQPSGAVEQTWPFPNQAFSSGEVKPYPVSWTAGATGGTYSVGVSVTGPGGSPGYYENARLTGVTVSTSKFTSSVAATRTSVPAGGTIGLTTTVQNTGTSDLVNGVVDLEIYDPAGNKTQTSWSGVNLAVGATGTYPYTWTAPATAGSYTVKVGVFSTGWADTLHWNGHAAQLTVANPTFALQASASPAKVMPGGPLSIDVSVTPTGGSVDNAIVDAEVYDSLGTRITGGQKSWSGQTLNNGTTYTYSWPLTAPATLGTYTVKVGVFPAGWGPVYKWVDNADTFEVANPSHTMTAGVSAASVTPGTPVTITASYTNNGGAMTNGILDMEIYDPSNVKTQKTWTGESVDNGYTATRSFTFTPTVPGTYTVRLGVFSSDWSKQWGWNNSAATISVGSTTFQPSFQIGDGANTWWFEVYTSNDVTSVDVIADNGRIYLSLPKKSWGAFAAQPPSEVLAGQSVQIIARRSSDGATASSTSFGWLTGTPATQAGWAGSVARGANCSTTWAEATAAATATQVWIKVGQSTTWTQLTYSATSGKYGKAMNISTGTKVIFKATRSDGSWAYSPIYSWLQ